MNIKLDEYFKKHPLLGALPCDEITALAKKSACNSYKKGEFVFLAGDLGNRVFIVTDGAVKLSHFTDQGEEGVIKLCAKGKTYGACFILADKEYPYSGIAVTDTSVIEIPAKYLLKRAHASPVVLDLILALISLEIEESQLESEQYKLMSTVQRVGCLLIRLSSEEKGNDRTFKFPYEKALAAKQLGVKPETFSRALSGLQPLNVVTNGAEVRIKNLSMLEAYCCSGCSVMDGGCNGCQGL